MVTCSWRVEKRHMMNNMGIGMMLGMGLVCLLVFGVLVFSIAALWKYLRSGKK